MSEGDDVIKGQVIAQPLTHMRYVYSSDLLLSLEKALLLLERTQRQHVQVVEFVIEDGVLFFLSARDAELSPVACVTVCVDMVRHHSISREEAVMRLDPYLMNYFMKPFLDPTSESSNLELGRGLRTSQGIVQKTKESLHE